MFLFLAKKIVPSIVMAAIVSAKFPGQAVKTSKQEKLFSNTNYWKLLAILIRFFFF